MPRLRCSCGETFLERVGARREGGSTINVLRARWRVARDFQGQGPRRKRFDSLSRLLLLLSSLLLLPRHLDVSPPPPPSRADYFKIQHPLSGLRSLASLHPPLPPSHLSSSLALPHHNPTPNRSRHDFNQVSSGSRAMSEFESRGKAESYIAARAASMANRWESRKSGKYKPRSKSGRRPSRAAPGLPASDNAAAIRCVTSCKGGRGGEKSSRPATGYSTSRPLSLLPSLPPSLPPSHPPSLPPFHPSSTALLRRRSSPTRGISL